MTVSRFNNWTAPAGAWTSRPPGLVGSRPAAAWQDPNVLPEDLRAWLDPCTLLAWIEAELDRMNWQNPRLQDHLQRHPEFRPRALLRLLSYAYATQVFGSVDIVRACYADKFYRLLCEGKPPFPEELACFRRRNHGLIQGVLSQLFLRAAREKRGLEVDRMAPELKTSLQDQAATRLDIARHLDRVDE